MKVYLSESIRNIGIVSHQGAGKTSLTESMLFNTGATNRLGKVDEGNTVADYHPEEIKRKSTVNASLVACEWLDTKINLLDTPGFSDFFGEVKGVLRVSDCLLMLVDAVAGVEVSTEIVWELADESNLPRIAFINKMDRENADFVKALDSMREKLTQQIVPIQFPIGSEANFNGIIDLIEMKAYQYDGGKSSEIPIPDDLMADAETYREMMIEAAAEGEDELTMKYLEGEELTDGEIIAGLKAGVMAGKVVPVLCGSALKNIGADLLLNILVHYAPTPLEKLEDQDAPNKPMASLVFKTMADPYVGRISFFRVYQGSFKSDSTAYNPRKEADEKISQLFTMQGKNQLQLPELKFGDIGIVAKLAQTNTGDTLTTKDSGVVLDGIDFPIPTLTVAIEPKTKGDEDKLGTGISRLLEEDPTLRLEKNVETHQTLLTGMGEAHIDITIDRLQRKFGVEVKTNEALVPYRETIRGSATKVEGKHKKQSGGHGQFGHVYIDVAPYPEGEFEFTETIFGGSVPRQYIPAVEKGVRESMVEGILAAYPVTNIKVNLQDGSFHPVDSSEMAFKIAASLAFRKACEQAKPALLEPIMNVEIHVPDQFMGDIMGDLNSKRGRILGMEKSGNMQVIKANVPLSEMYRYAIDLKSITQGRGSFVMEFSRYEEVPSMMSEKIIAAAKAAKE